MSISMNEVQKRINFMEGIKLMISLIDTKTPVSCFRIKDGKYIDYGVIQTESLPRMYSEFRPNFWVSKINEQITNVRSIVLCEEVVVVFFIDGSPVYINDPTFHRAMETVFLRV